MSKRFSLVKHERIKSRVLMTHVFEEGESLFSYPFKLVYAPLLEGDKRFSMLKFGVTVPKRIHSKAVRRNKIKRLVREAYRMAKPELLDAIIPNKIGYSLMYIYISKDVPEIVSLSNQISKLHRKWLSAIHPKE